MKIQKNYPMSKLTTLKIGGPAKYFLEAKNETELKLGIEFAQKEKVRYIIIGGGSNLLISDEGFPELVIKMIESGIKISGNTVSVRAGTKLQDLVDFTIKNGFGGVNKMTGIPGTVAGAIYGNAAAYGQSISDNLISVSCFNGENFIVLQKEDCKFNYRDSAFKINKFLILEASFIFFKGNIKSLKKESYETLKKRLLKYPPQIKSPGSFFKNVIASELPKDVLDKIPSEKILYGKIPAGFLLESVGAKGDKLGQIMIAANHGNTFINLGGGSAQDFHKLASKYAKKVSKKFGINLEPEVQLINLPPISH